MDQVIFIVNLAVAIGGIYIAYHSAKMKKTHKIAGQIFLSNDLQIRRCKREAEYCEYVAPKGFISGVLIAISSGLAALGYFYDALVIFTNWGFVIVLAVYVWFLSYSGKANRTYF